jgi:uncharacterized protein YehS (DUF1456 family)
MSRKIRGREQGFLMLEKNPLWPLFPRGDRVTNNEILRRIASMFDIDETNMIEIFGLGGLMVTRDQVTAWIKDDTDPQFQQCSDPQFASFLNGFIVNRRGKKEGARPAPEQQLTNNVIFHKLRIALDLQAEDILEILELSDIEISKHELSAFFRKPGHKHYRECKDSILLGFLNGAQIMYSDESGESK